MVNRHKWLADHVYADIVPLSQFRPCPASSLVGFALGSDARRVAEGTCGRHVVLPLLEAELMQGANAAVVGILGAALNSPMFTSAITDLRDFTLALACFVLLLAWKMPPWGVVVVAALGGVGLAVLGRTRAQGR